MTSRDWYTNPPEDAEELVDFWRDNEPEELIELATWLVLHHKTAEVCHLMASMACLGDWADPIEVDEIVETMMGVGE